MKAPITGTLLIAEPFLKDPNFARTVVLMCRHDAEEGSFGFVLNKKYHQTLDELIPELDEFPYPVYRGGPVQLDTLHYIHQYPLLLPDSQKISEDIYWGGDFDMLKSLMIEGRIEQEKIKFFLGYSGWSMGQLDEEMKENTWLTVGGTRPIVFETAMDDIWKASLQQLGGKYEMMIHFPTDPQLN
ncbi:MAG: YqgE/AlgH family protein [Ferruginibacter sp.]|nr:YqgE/AlgH family protein [Ferruginibacter sp.]